MKRKTFVENPLYKKLAELLYERVASMSRGDVITHKEISATITFDKDATGWQAVLLRCRKMLRAVGIVLVPVAGLGYKVPLEDEGVQYVTFSRTRKRIRQARRERQELEPMPTGGMSVCGQLLRTTAIDRAAKQEKLMRADYRGLSAVYAKDEANKTPIPAR